VETLIEFKKVSKHFGVIKALQDVDFKINPGELVGLVGDNGAGKSTFIKLIAGIFQPTSGSIHFRGNKLTSFNPHISRELGIQAVHQQVGLVDTLSVERNMVLGDEPLKGRFFIDKKKMRSRTQAMFEEIGIYKFAPSTLVGVLSGGQKQAIKLGRSISDKDTLLLLDEPITGLSVRETYHVLELVQKVRDKQVAVIFITHDVHQVYSIADRIVILERGRKILDIPKRERTPEEIVNIIRHPDLLGAEDSGKGE